MIRLSSLLASNTTRVRSVAPRSARHSREGAEGFIKKLGVKRCFIVKSDYKDANDSLRNGEDMIKVINSATVKRHEDIQTFQTLRRDVISELIEPAKYSGVRPESLPGLGNIIKGTKKKN